MSKTSKEKALEKLIKIKDLKKNDLDAVKSLQQSQGLSLEKALMEKGFINESELIEFLSIELEIPYINLSRFKIDPSLQEIISEKVARQYKIIPLSLLASSLTLAVSDPQDIFVLDDLKHITGKNIEIALTTSSNIDSTIDSFYGADSVVSVSDIRQDIDVEDFEIVMDKDDDEDSKTSSEGSEKAPVIRMVNLVLTDALHKKASDIHIEPGLNNVRVRFRVDGVLENVLTIPKENQNSIIVRIKIMSQVDITVNQTPQDGRFQMKFGSKEVDFRVSFLPTTFGQKIVMRILDKGNLSAGITGIGLREKPLAIVIESIRKPFGMILITGPTGSGKSTTLYSMINELNTVDKNIITVEDPVEYLIDGLTQIQTKSEIGLTFAEGLRAMLRQSPDVVMVGEIRDGETADIAIKSSLTGQLVLSTLHTNDATGALTRLIDMGVEPFLVASSIVMVSAQRLCRKICPKCKEKEDIPIKTLEDLSYNIPTGTVFYKGKGCEACHDTGYQGRTAITEILDVSDTIRERLLQGKSSDEIKKFAREEEGMETLFEDAMFKCIDGVITMEEVLRVTTSE